MNRKFLAPVALVKFVMIIRTIPSQNEETERTAERWSKKAEQRGRNQVRTTSSTSSK